MINITNREAKLRYHAEMLRQMTVLEHQFAKKFSPVLNRQYMDVAKLVASGVTYGYSHLVDKQDARSRELLITHYRQVATIFSKKVYDVIEEGQGKGIFPPYQKSPEDEFWRALNLWMVTQAGRKIKYIRATTKAKIAQLIQKGMNEGESHREIAKRIRKTGYIANPKRALNIARTETHTTAVYSVQESVNSTRLETEREWSRTPDERVRADHNAMASHPRVKKGEPYTVPPIGGVKMMYPGDPAGGASQVVNCIATSRAKVFTSTGQKDIRFIRPGDLVLTHKNRFRKVLRTRKRKYSGDIIEIRFGNNKGAHDRRIQITPNHPFLINGEWVLAKDICVGDQINILASYCENCGNPIPYYNKFCSKLCWSKYVVPKQWADPNHRKIISKKAKRQMKREYANGIRDRYKIVEKARSVCFDKYGAGGYLGVVASNPDFRDKWRKAVENKYGSVLDMLKQTCFVALGKIGGSGSGSKLEEVMSEFLMKTGRSFVREFLVGRRRVDFYVEDEKLFIEVDGFPFHQDQEEERKRDLEILSEYPDHKIAHVIYGSGGPKWEFFDLFSLNHDGIFTQVQVEVNNVRVFRANRTVYNFAVEEDQSYIVKGLVSHNCRCVELFYTVRRT